MTEPTDDDLGEVVDPDMLPAPQPKASIPQDRFAPGNYPRQLPPFLAFAAGDLRLTAWEEGFIANLTQLCRWMPQGFRLTEKQCAVLNRIAGKLDYSPDA